MITRKNYNSVIFLTTLSVYLGLVLVGAPAPVLAQAALTGRFEVKDKIEKKDDLDKNPDEEEISSFFELGLDEAVIDFVDNLRQLKQQGKYKSNFSKTFTVGCSHSFCSENVGSFVDATASISVENRNSKIYDALWNLHNKIEVSERKSFYENLYADVKKSDGCQRINLELVFDKKELNIKIGFTKNSPQKAFLFAENLNRGFIVESSLTTNLLTTQIYENTKATAENNQVFIVTRLPRGSLDALIAQRSAQ